MGCDTKRCKEKRLVMEAVWRAQQCLQSADESEITHISQCHHQSQQHIARCLFHILTWQTSIYLSINILFTYIPLSQFSSDGVLFVLVKPTKITMCHLMLLPHQKYSSISIKLTVPVIFVFANADYQ